MKPETARKITADDRPKRYLVEYREEEAPDATHNVYYFETFEEAQRKYLHLGIDQVTESRLIRVIRLRAYNDYHARYITIFEARTFHPAALYDTPAHHMYPRGSAPVSPRVTWKSPQEI